MSMGLVPHHLICDHTHLWEFSNMQKEFLEQLYFWPFELIHLGVFSLPFEFEFEFHLIFFDECKVTLILAHYLTEGSDKSIVGSIPLSISQSSIFFRILSMRSHLSSTLLVWN